jgi:hypothetical protein
VLLPLRTYAIHRLDGWASQREILEPGTNRSRCYLSQLPELLSPGWPFDADVAVSAVNVHAPPKPEGSRIGWIPSLDHEKDYH